jgi:hypothetical protein
MIYTKHIHALYGQDADFLNIKAYGTNILAHFLSRANHFHIICPDGGFHAYLEEIFCISSVLAVSLYP